MDLRGHSIWLLPEAEVRALLRDLIGMCASRFGAPLFEPHMTLLGRLHGSDLEQMLDRTAAIAAAIKPMRLRTTGLATSNQLYRALTIGIAFDAQLKRAQDIARRVFPLDSPASWPHLSLLYATGDPAANNPLLAELDARIPPSIGFDSVQLTALDGPVERWRALQTLPLST